MDDSRDDANAGDVGGSAPPADSNSVYEQDPLFELTEKICTRCKESKPLHAFNRYARSPDGHQPHCRDCSKAYYRANREKHLTNVARRRRAHRRSMRRKVLEYLEDHPCVDCGETDPAVLEFDHVRGTKLANVAEMVRGDGTWQGTSEEISKCEVRCANCHRRRTARVEGWYETAREARAAYCAATYHGLTALGRMRP